MTVTTPGGGPARRFPEAVTVAKLGVILPAAGASRRFGSGGPKKPFQALAGRPVWQHAADRVFGREDVVRRVVVVAAADVEFFREKYAAAIRFYELEVVVGGAERSDSVAAALARMPAEVSHVVVHDAARPVVAESWVDAVVAAALETGAAILATPIANTIKRGEDVRPSHPPAGRGPVPAAPQPDERPARPAGGPDALQAMFGRSGTSRAPGKDLMSRLAETRQGVRDDPSRRRAICRQTVSREGLWLAQTPQVFAADLLRKAHAAARGGPPATDDAELVERIGHPVTLVECPALNIKITTAADLAFAEAALAALPRPARPVSAHPFDND